jgi:hypothetical protein
MKKTVFTSLFIFFAIFLNGQTISLISAANKVGQQQLLCEKMLKDYAILGANSNSKEAKTELDNSVTLFNQNINDLTQYVNATEAVVALNDVNDLWPKFRNVVLKNPTPENFQLLLVDANRLVEACNLVAENIHLDENIEVAKLARICGRQRILSQRLAKLYMIANWKVDYPKLDKELHASINTFEYSLGKLMIYTENPPEIKTLLNKQYDDWSKLKPYFEDMTTLRPDVVFAETNAILKDFEKTTSLYEKILDQQKLQDLNNKNVTISKP